MTFYLPTARFTASFTAERLLNRFFKCRLGFIPCVIEQIIPNIYLFTLIKHWVQLSGRARGAEFELRFSLPHDHFVSVVGQSGSFESAFVSLKWQPNSLVKPSIASV